MKVWLLTYEVNEYDQQGEYFKAVFKDKPTPEQLLKLGIREQEIPHVLNGGGRRDDEYQWYHLCQEKAL